jgi:hypothetical protein
VQANSSGTIPSKKQIIIFKAGGHWVFKHYFDDRDIFRELVEYYDKDKYCFVLKTVGDRNRALKLLEIRGFVVALVENAREYVVKLNKYRKYGPILKNSVAQIENPEWRIFLMKDQTAVKEALQLGAKMVEVDVRF